MGSPALPPKGGGCSRAVPVNVPRHRPVGPATRRWSTVAPVAAPGPPTSPAQSDVLQGTATVQSVLSISSAGLAHMDHGAFRGKRFALNSRKTQALANGSREPGPAAGSMLQTCLPGRPERRRGGSWARHWCLSPSFASCWSGTTQQPWPLIPLPQAYWMESF